MLTILASLRRTLHRAGAPSALDRRRWWDKLAANHRSRVKVLNIYYSNTAFGGVERFLTTLMRCRDLAPSLELAFGLFPEGPFSERLSALGASLLPLDFRGGALAKSAERAAGAKEPVEAT
jgi:hypothetical protein